MRAEISAIWDKIQSMIDSFIVLLVNTAFENRRMEYDVGIGYGDDLDQAKQLMLEAMHSVDEVLKDSAPDVLVMELAESNVNIRARWWITPPRRIDDLRSRDKDGPLVIKKFPNPAALEVLCGN